MRVATWNLLHGRSTTDGEVHPERLAAAARRLDADVLALQEVDVGAVRSGGADQAAAVVAALGAGWHRFAAAVVGTPGAGPWRAATDEDDGGDGPRFGVALVSRLPVRRSEVRRLPASPVPGLIVNPQTGRPVPLRDEPRAVLLAELDVPWGPVRVACTHLSFVPGWNVGQLVALLRAARPAGFGSALVLADLHVPAALTRALARRWRLLAAVPTYPGRTPRIQFDHVLGCGPLPAPSAVDTSDVGVGDHRPVVVTL